MNSHRYAAIESAAFGTKGLERMDNDQLLEELGVRLVAIRQEPKVSNQFGLSIDAEQRTRLTKAELIALGRRLLDIWNRELYKFLCEESTETSEERKRIFAALVGQDATVASMLIGLLVGHFGVAPAIAFVVGTLVARILIVPTGTTVCVFWKERLKAYTN
jgi:hypothetical protein